jgi:hypothetical protein
MGLKFANLHPNVNHHSLILFKIVYTISHSYWVYVSNYKDRYTINVNVYFV